MSDVVLGVDSSTQSCTVELRDVETGELIAAGRAPHPATTPPVSEQHPDEWWTALVIATRQALANTVKPVNVVGVSVGAQCHGLVILDGQGQVIRPAKLWNDTTSGPQAAGLVEQYGMAWWADEIGLVPSAAVTITKLAWLRDNEPDSLARIRYVCVPHDWLTYRLTGHHISDRSDASGTGYYSAAQGRWRSDLLDEVVGPLSWQNALPEVLGPDEPAGMILPEVATELGISASAVVSPGGGDQHLAAQGIGLSEGETCYSLGTSGVVFATTGSPIHDTTGSIDGVANATGGYLPLICTLNAAKVTDAMARLLNVDHDELSRLALAAPVDPGRPVMVAYLDGERSPRLPHARGMISGLSSTVTREQLALSGFEGVAMGLVAGEQRLRDYGVDVSGRSILVGGGAKSAAYRQIIADLTGRAAHTVDAPEATARGAAVQASAIARGLTVAQVTADWRPASTSITAPQRDRMAGFGDRYQRLAELQFQGQEF